MSGSCSDPLHLCEASREILLTPACVLHSDWPLLNNDSVTVDLIAWL